MNYNDKKGALPYQSLIELIKSGSFQNVDLANVSPASIDITMSSEIYRIDGVFLPKHGESVRELIKKFSAVPHHPNSPFEKGVVYIARMNEVFTLPFNIYGFCNPKSSTGRHDLHVRIVTDSTARYDTLRAGSSSELWALIIPRSYPVKMKENFSISQVRFFSADTRFTEQDLKDEWQRAPLVYHLDGRPYAYESIKMKDGDGSILLTLDLSQQIVGYECRGTQRIMDLASQNGSVDANDFFTPIYKNGEYITLHKDSFYILSTKEALRVPPYLASEMVDMDSRTGEFRTHYAGFFDPGWGFGDGSGKGRPITLEVRPFEDVIISHGQPIGKVRFEKTTDEPTLHYDEKNSNYLKQSGPKLAKQFKVI